MATTHSRDRLPLREDAPLPEVVAAVNELAERLEARRATSPSAPLDAAEPSASIVYTDEEYDAFVERLGARAAPNEPLRHTMLGTAGGVGESRRGI